MKRKVGLIFLIAVLGVLLVWGFGEVKHCFVIWLNPFLGSIVVLVILLVLVVLVFGMVRRMRRREGFGPGDWFWVVSLGWLLVGLFRWREKDYIDIQLNDTYFVFASFPLFAGLAAVFGLLAVIYTVYPRVVGRPLQYTLGMIHFWICFLGVIFFPFFAAMFWSGMSRRYLGFERWSTFRSSYAMYVDTSAGKMLLLVLFVQVLFLVNLVYSALARPKSGD